MAKTIEDYKRDYAAAQARGDKKGMAAANNAANALRKKQGQEVQVADVTKEIYGESYIGAPGSDATNAIITGNASDEAVKKMMAENSQGWHIAQTQEEKDWYHQENEKLASSLGDNITFDPVTGTWSGPTDSALSYSTSPRPTVEENDGYIRDMYDARLREALAQLEAAYQNNLSALDRSTIGVDARYQNARNQAAGASERSARNFAEFAAATGLNSGAAGQAELARNMTLQNNLSALSQDEANFYADIEMQKAQAEVDYNNAIAQARASNDYAAAQALYEEKVRVQNALLQREIYQMEYDLQAAAQKSDDQKWWQEYDYATQHDRTSQLIANGWNALNSGMIPSEEALAAMGITLQQAQNYISSRPLINAVSGG